jgi:acyl-CoA synthetase (AMP-forming)/AMP-acid ligase II
VAQRPVHTGGRLSRNAAGPSCASALWYTGAQIRSAASNTSGLDRYAVRLAASTDSGAFAAIRSASTVLDASGGDLAGQPGVAGEAVYRSPAVMAGYYRDEAATRHAFRYGWFHSGDSCAYDDIGLRIMLDRYKDIVKTGGENVSSLRVEAVLAQHPDVAKAAVIGLPHPRWSEAVTAVVVLRDGAEASEDDLIKHCRASLAGYETPKSVVFAAGLPETVGGKVLKYKLRAEHAGHYRNVTEPF